MKATLRRRGGGRVKKQQPGEVSLPGGVPEPDSEQIDDPDENEESQNDEPKGSAEASANTETKISYLDDGMGGPRVAIMRPKGTATAYVPQGNQTDYENLWNGLAPGGADAMSFLAGASTFVAEEIEVWSLR